MLMILRWGAFRTAEESMLLRHTPLHFGSFLDTVHGLMSMCSQSWPFDPTRIDQLFTWCKDEVGTMQTKKKKKTKMYCNMVWIKDGSGMNSQWRCVVLSGSPRTWVNRFGGGGGDSAGPISILWVRLSVLFSSYALVSGCTLPAVRFAIIKFCTRNLHLAAIDSDLHPGPLKVTRRMWLVVEIRVGGMSSGNKAFMPPSVEGEKTGCSWEVNETLWLSLPCEKGEHTPNTEGQSSTWNISGKLRFGFQEADWDMD